MHTVVEVSAAEYLPRMKATVDEAHTQSIAAATHHGELVKAAAGKLVTESAGYIATQVTQRVTVAVADVACLDNDSNPYGNRNMNRRRAEHCCASSE